MVHILDSFDADESTNSKIIVVLSDYNTYVTDSTMQRILEDNITVYAIVLPETEYIASTESKTTVVNNKEVGQIHNLVLQEEILIHTLSQSQQYALNEIANYSGGTYTTDELMNIRIALYLVKSGTILQIDTTDTDGDGIYDVYEDVGMRLINGTFITSDKNKHDTDGDTLNDRVEMGPLKYYIDQVPFIGIHKFYYYQWESDPNEVDSDFDGYNDDIDAKPLIKIEDVTYIFYELGGDWFLEKEARVRAKFFERVYVYGVNTLVDFTDKWNGMGIDSNGKVEYEISDVYTVFHGGPNSIQLGYDNINKRDIVIYSSNISSLKKKKIDILHLSSCNNGNLDFLNAGNIQGMLQNIAITFLKEMPDIKQVEAWDGYATYFMYTEWASSYTTIAEFFGSDNNFDKWSLEKNGKRRHATGLITYEKDSSGNIVYTPNIKYFRKLTILQIKRITEVIQ